MLQCGIETAITKETRKTSNKCSERDHIIEDNRSDFEACFKYGFVAIKDGTHKTSIALSVTNSGSGDIDVEARSRFE